jgi:hypothetical protein
MPTLAAAPWCARAREPLGPKPLDDRLRVIVGELAHRWRRHGDRDTRRNVARHQFDRIRVVGDELLVGDHQWVDAANAKEPVPADFVRHDPASAALELCEVVDGFDRRERVASGRSPPSRGLGTQERHRLRIQVDPNQPNEDSCREQALDEFISTVVSSDVRRTGARFSARADELVPMHLRAKEPVRARRMAVHR